MTDGINSPPRVENQEKAKEKVSCDPDQESSNPNGDRMDSESSETEIPFKKEKDDFIVEDDDEVSSGEEASDDEDEIEELKNNSKRRVQITVRSILDYIGKHGNGGPGSGYFLLMKFMDFSSSLKTVINERYMKVSP